MDIVLTRILSLIPKKPDGKFVHGALKEFANNLNLKSGNVVSDWMNGRSTSYTSYVYQIANIYNVSVEWLKGETDDPGIKKAPDPKIGGVSADDPYVGEIFAFIDNSSKEERESLMKYIAFLKNQRGGSGL